MAGPGWPAATNALTAAMGTSLPLELLVTPSTDTTPPLEVTPNAWGERVVEVAPAANLAWLPRAWVVEEDFLVSLATVVEVDLEVVGVVPAVVVGDEPVEEAEGGGTGATGPTKTGAGGLGGAGGAVVGLAAGGAVVAVVVVAARVVEVEVVDEVVVVAVDDQDTAKLAVWATPAESVKVAATPSVPLPVPE